MVTKPIKGRRIVSIQPLVTVIIPIYNVGKYIDKCISTVLAQTYENIELILVNDGSPDNAGDICDAYAEKDHRVKVVHKKNSGVSSARNSGLDIAKGDYIMFIDGDDWVDNDHVEYLLSLCLKSDALMSMSYKMHTLKKVNVDNFKDKQALVNGVDMAADLLYQKTVVGSCNKMFKRELIYRNNLRYDEELFIGEGYNFIVMCAQLAGMVSTGQRMTYYYRLDNTESAMTRFNVAKVHNNDIALDRIKRDFVVESRKLSLAWNYARWITSLNFAVWLKMSTSKGEYVAEYKKMLRDVRLKAPLIIPANVSAARKVAAVVGFVSPKFLVAILELKKKMYVR